MKEIIDVELKIRKVDFSKCKTDLLAAGQFCDTKGLDKLNAELNQKLGGAIEQVIKFGDFKGKAGRAKFGNGRPARGHDQIGRTPGFSPAPNAKMSVCMADIVDGMTIHKIDPTLGTFCEQH